MHGRPSQKSEPAAFRSANETTETAIQSLPYKNPFDKMAPELIVKNAKIYTCDPAKPWAEALASEGGKVSAVGPAGDIEKLAGPATQVVDAGVCCNAASSNSEQ